MANKRELLKEFGPRIIEIYGPDELKWIRDNFDSDELERYISDHDKFRRYKETSKNKTRGKTMPQGKGTYGSNVGRPKTIARKGKTKMTKADKGKALEKAVGYRKTVTDKDRAAARKLIEQQLNRLKVKMKDAGLKTTARKKGGVTTAKKGKTKFSGGTSKTRRGLLKKLGKDSMTTAKKGKAKVGK